MTIAMKAALLAAATLGWAPAASAADFVTYRITTSGIGSKTTLDVGGTEVVTALTDLVFTYTVPFSAIADGRYDAVLPGQHGLFFDGSAMLSHDGGKLVIDDRSLAFIPGAAPVGSAAGTACLSGTSGGDLPTGTIAIADPASCGGSDLSVFYTTRDESFSYTGAFTGLRAMLGDGTPDTYGIALAVPEPSSWALMLVGFAATGYALRRRRAQVAIA